MADLNSPPRALQAGTVSEISFWKFFATIALLLQASIASNKEDATGQTVAFPFLPLFILFPLEKSKVSGRPEDHSALCSRRFGGTP